MSRVFLAVVIAVLGAGAVITGAVIADYAPSGARHSDNMELIANYSDGGTYRNGTDMAFKGNLLLLGNLDQGVGPNASPPGGFRLMDITNPAQPEEISQFVCSGDQSDVSIWGDIVITSIDKPTTSGCDGSGESNWEGLRIVSIEDRQSPEVLTTVRTDCGSHTHTIYPDEENDRLLVYVLSYPLAGRYNPAGAMPTCNPVSHRKISVVEVPLDAPQNASVIGTPSVETNIGCHDVTVFLDRGPGGRDLAAAACLTESQIWDLSDPEQPDIIATIRDPRINIHHSTAFSNDGQKLIIGDELGGAAASPGCFSDKDTHGGLFFYDLTDPASPQLKQTFKLPQQEVSLFCTAHLFNVVPLRSGADVLVSSWYTGATSVIDFSDLDKKPEQIAYYIPNEPVTPDEQPREAAAWASYWYRGHIYSNNFDEDVNSVSPRSRGLDVYRVEHPLLDDALPLPHLNPQLQQPLPASG